MAELREVRQSRHVNVKRLAAVTAGFCLWVVIVQAKLIIVQVYQHDQWVAAAKQQQEQTISLDGRRGDIVDRNGRPLAVSVDAFKIRVNPQQIKKRQKEEGLDAPRMELQRQRVAAEVCKALEGDPTSAPGPGCVEDLFWKLRPERGDAELSRQVRPEIAAAVKAIFEAHFPPPKPKTPSYRKTPVRVLFQPDPRRYYPNRELAAHVLGFTGDEGGLAGVEKVRDAELRGRKGRLTLLKDGRALETGYFGAEGTPPSPGATLELTIDSTMQSIVERELRAGVIENQAEGGVVVVMDPRTGEIPALASYPPFNPHSRRATLHRATETNYEPGSTFKMVTAAAALDEGTVTPDTLIHTGDGKLRVPGRTKLIEDTHPHGTISVSQVIGVSSNIGAVKIGETVGTARLEAHVKRFGFGTRLSRDIDSEEAGLLAFPKVGSRGETSERASICMGYQIMVTPLQMASAFAAVANGGLQMQPRLVRAIIDGSRRITPPVSTNWPRQVMKPETARALLPALESVVSEEGTARFAEVPGFTVAGKTGTSHKHVPGIGYTSDYHSSFVGFVPSRQPELVILVLIDSPRGKNGHYGGKVAGPVFSRIAEASLRHLGVKPTENPLSPVLKKRASATQMVSSPVTALTIMPPAPRTLDGQTPLPDVRGFSGRDALRELVKRGLSARLTGDGVVVEQDPPAGTTLPPGSVCRLTLARVPRAGAAGIQP